MNTISDELYNQLLAHLEKTETNNSDLLIYFQNHKGQFQGPIQVTISQIQRTVGPEPEMLNLETEEEFNKQVKLISDKIKSFPNTPVLLAAKSKETYYLLDGNHTFEALKANGMENFDVVFTEDRLLIK